MSSLPPGVEKRWDPTVKKFFYVDHANQTTSWEAPSTKSPPPPAPSTTSGATTVAKPVPSGADDKADKASRASRSVSIAGSGKKETEEWWAPDASSTTCFLCSAKFTFMSRQHHCRCCGQVVCVSCSANKAAVPDLSLSTPVRVCTFCHSNYLQDGAQHKQSQCFPRLLCKMKFSPVVAQQQQAAQVMADSLTTDDHCMTAVKELTSTSLPIIINLVEVSTDDDLRLQLLRCISNLLSDTELRDSFHSLGGARQLLIVCDNLIGMSHGANHRMQALRGLSYLCQSETLKDGLRSDGIITVLLSALRVPSSHASDPIAQEWAITALFHLAQNNHTNQTILRQEALSILCELLESPNAGTVEHSCLTLLSLMPAPPQPGAQSAMAGGDGSGAMTAAEAFVDARTLAISARLHSMLVPLMVSPKKPVQNATVDLLWRLCCPPRDSMVDEVILFLLLESQGLSNLMTMWSRFQNSPLDTMETMAATLRLVGNMITVPDDPNLCSIVETTLTAGPTLQALAGVLKVDCGTDTSVHDLAIQTLRQLADCKTVRAQPQLLTQAVMPLMDLLARSAYQHAGGGGGTVNTQVQCVSLLCDFATQPVLASRMADHGAIPTLLGLLESPSAQLQVSAVSTLERITRIPEHHQAMHDSGAMDTLQSFRSSSRDEECKRHCAAILARIAAVPAAAQEAQASCKPEDFLGLCKSRNPNDQKSGLAALQKLCEDAPFARDLCKKGGLNVLCDLILSGDPEIQQLALLTFSMVWKLVDDQQGEEGGRGQSGGSGALRGQLATQMVQGLIPKLVAFMGIGLYDAVPAVPFHDHLPADNSGPFSMPPALPTLLNGSQPVLAEAMRQPPAESSRVALEAAKLVEIFSHNPEHWSMIMTSGCMTSDVFISLMLSSGQSHATPVRRKLAVIIFDILSNVFAGLNRPEFFRELNPSAWGRPLAKGLATMLQQIFPELGVLEAAIAPTGMRRAPPPGVSKIALYSKAMNRLSRLAEDGILRMHVYEADGITILVQAAIHLLLVAPMQGVDMAAVPLLEQGVETLQVLASFLSDDTVQTALGRSGSAPWIGESLAQLLTPPPQMVEAGSTLPPVILKPLSISLASISHVPPHMNDSMWDTLLNKVGLQPFFQLVASSHPPAVEGALNSIARVLNSEGRSSLVQQLSSWNSMATLMNAMKGMGQSQSGQLESCLHILQAAAQDHVCQSTFVHHQGVDQLCSLVTDVAMPLALHMPVFAIFEHISLSPANRTALTTSEFCKLVVTSICRTGRADVLGCLVRLLHNVKAIPEVQPSGTQPGQQPGLAFLRSCISATPKAEGIAFFRRLGHEVILASQDLIVSGNWDGSEKEKAASLLTSLAFDDTTRDWVAQTQVVETFLTFLTTCETTAPTSSHKPLLPHLLYIIGALCKHPLLAPRVTSALPRLSLMQYIQAPDTARQSLYLLVNLTSSDTASRQSLLAAGALPVLLELVSRDAGGSESSMAMAIVSNLAKDRPNRVVLHEQGLVSILCKILKRQDIEAATVQYALNSVMCLSWDPKCRVAFTEFEEHSRTEAVEQPAAVDANSPAADDPSTTPSEDTREEAESLSVVPTVEEAVPFIISTLAALLRTKSKVEVLVDATGCLERFVLDCGTARSSCLAPLLLPIVVQTLKDDATNAELSIACISLLQTFLVLAPVAMFQATAPADLIAAACAVITRLSQAQPSEVTADSACVLSLRFLQTLAVVTDCTDFIPANLHPLVAQLASNESLGLVALEAKQLSKLLA